MDFVDAILIPITVGLVEAIKRFGVGERFLPSVAILIGLLISYINTPVIGSEMILSGLVYGLSAVGLFSGVKNTIK